MATIIPYTNDALQQLKLKTVNVGQRNVSPTAPVAGSEFYESLSMEIDCALQDIVGRFGTMITETASLESAKNNIRQVIENYITRYRQFVKPDFSDYYQSHHSLGWYAELLGEGYVVSVLRDCC